MNNLKSFQKMLSKNTLFLVFAGIVLLLGIMYYSNNKQHVDNMGTRNVEFEEEPQVIPSSHESTEEPVNQEVEPANPVGENLDYLNVSGLTSREVVGKCSSVENEDPVALLPNDQSSAWADLNPNGAGNLGDVNLLKAGHHIGIDTVGQSLRNANLQIRSEPANPQVNVSPWNNTTIQPDTNRVPLQIGQGPQ